MKRTIDVLFASISLLLFLPVGLAIAAILRMTGEGEVFYRQERIGKGRRIFGLLKFATMLKNSPNIGTGTVTVKGDPRVLPLGKFLRKTKINEIPQLWNVLVGDMSLVGPRPLTVQTFNYYPREVQEQISSITPGLTGIGSIVFRDEESILAASSKSPLDCYREDISPYKGALELWYLKRQDPCLDLKLLLLTLVVVLRPGTRAIARWLPDLPQRPVLHH